MVPGDNFLSLSSSVCLSLSLFLITKHDIHGYFFFPPSWLQRGQLLVPLLVRPAGGNDRRLALFTFAASRVIWLIVWLMGGLRGSPHTVLHNEDSFMFNTIECLSHSTLCEEDWLSLCPCSPEAFAPSSSFRQAYVPAPACCSWTRKRQASFFSLFFLSMNWLPCVKWDWNSPRPWLADA